MPTIPPALTASINPLDAFKYFTVSFESKILKSAVEVTNWLEIKAGITDKIKFPRLNVPSKVISNWLRFPKGVVIYVYVQMYCPGIHLGQLVIWATVLI